MAPDDTLLRKAIKKENLNRIWEPPSLENFLRQTRKVREARDQSSDEAPQHEPSTKRRKSRVSWHQLSSVLLIGSQWRWVPTHSCRFTCFFGRSTTKGVYRYDLWLLTLCISLSVWISVPLDCCPHVTAVSWPWKVVQGRSTERARHACWTHHRIKDFIDVCRFDSNGSLTLTIAYPRGRNC